MDTDLGIARPGFDRTLAQLARALRTDGRLSRCCARTREVALPGAECRPTCDSAAIRACIATPHRLATASGQRALDSGGSAADAAIAAAAVLTVAYPHMCSLGGDLFALVREPDGGATVINASGPAPQAIDVARLRAGGQMPRTGADAVTVPGLVAGWGALHDLAGQRPWAENLSDAETLARDGVQITRRLAEAIDELRPSNHLAEVFAPDGSALPAGASLRQPALADTLAELARSGARSLYEGELAARFAEGLAALGSPISRGDLAAFRPVAEAPLRASFGAVELLTAGPNSSGILLAQAIRALDRLGLSDPLGSDAGRLAAIFRAGMRQRACELGDPLYSSQDPDRWLGHATIDSILEPQALGHRTTAATGDTVAVVVVDDAGRAVSLNQSLFDSFGAELLEPQTGILLHNRASAFSLVPGHPNELAPDKRPAHTLMPAVIEEAGLLRGALATMGGAIHAQIHTQVLLRLLAGEDPSGAVAAPRFAAVDGMVIAESDIAAGLRHALRPSRLLPKQSELFGHAQVIWRASLRSQAFQAGTDPRADP